MNDVDAILFVYYDIVSEYICFHDLIVAQGLFAKVEVVEGEGGGIGDDTV